jgi:hypothetical protein
MGGLLSDGNLPKEFNIQRGKLRALTLDFVVKIADVVCPELKSFERVCCAKS